MAPWNFVGLPFPAWVEPPPFDEIQAASYLGSQCPALAPALARYHALPKDQIATLGERQLLLAQLAAVCAAHIHDRSLGFCFAWLKELAEGKAQYLGCLEQITGEGWHEPTQLSSYLDAGDAPGEWKALRLTREIYLFPERSVFWGNYAMECLDPCHRQLADLYRVWQKQASRVPYLLWLEDFSSFTHDRWMRYFTEDEQAEKEILVSEGRLATRKGRLLSCAERQHFLFVIDLQKRLLVTRAEPHVCHASFTRGQGVLGSGILQARDGVLVHIKFESGHYLSGPQEWWRALHFLRERGAEWGDKLRVTVFDRFRYISTRIDRSDLERTETFIQALGLA